MRFRRIGEGYRKVRGFYLQQPPQSMTFVRLSRPGLKPQEDTDLVFVLGQVQNKSAVLPNTILVALLPRVALFHVNIVDSIAGFEAEVLVFCLFSSPQRTKGIQRCRRHVQRAFDVLIHLLAQVVIESRHFRRQSDRSVEWKQIFPHGIKSTVQRVGNGVKPGFVFFTLAKPLH
jgi:hypothetical protein